MTQKCRLVHFIYLGITLCVLFLIISLCNLGIGISDFQGCLRNFYNEPFTIPSKSDAPKTLVRVVRQIEESSEEDLVTNDIFIAEFFVAANRFRAIHGVPKLKRNETLLQDAEEWATTLAERSDKAGTPVFNFSNKYITGESIWGGRNFSEISGTTVASKWYSECPRHNWLDNFFLPESSDFTQLVWKDTETAGIAKVTSPKEGITILVARYWPAGNWAYRTSFNSNVFPATVTQNDRQDGDDCFTGNNILKAKTPPNPRRKHIITGRVIKRKKHSKNHHKTTTTPTTTTSTTTMTSTTTPTTTTTTASTTTTTTTTTTASTTTPTTIPTSPTTSTTSPTTSTTSPTTSTTLPTTSTTTPTASTTSPTTTTTTAITTTLTTTPITTTTTTPAMTATTTAQTTASAGTETTTTHTTNSTAEINTTISTTTPNTVSTAEPNSTTVESTTASTVATSISTTASESSIPTTTVSTNGTNTNDSSTTIVTDLLATTTESTANSISGENMEGHGRAINMFQQNVLRKSTPKTQATTTPPPRPQKHIMVLVTDKEELLGGDATESYTTQPQPFSFDEYDDPFDEIVEGQKTFDEYADDEENESPNQNETESEKQTGRMMIMSVQGNSSEVSRKNASKSPSAWESYDGNFQPTEKHPHAKNETEPEKQTGGMLIVSVQGNSSEVSRQNGSKSPSAWESNDTNFQPTEKHPHANGRHIVALNPKHGSVKLENGLNHNEHLLKEITHHMRTTELQNKELLNRIYTLEKIILNLVQETSKLSTTTVSSSSVENVGNEKFQMQKDSPDLNTGTTDDVSPNSNTNEQSLENSTTENPQGNLGRGLRFRKKLHHTTTEPPIWEDSTSENEANDQRKQFRQRKPQKTPLIAKHSKHNSEEALNKQRHGLRKKKNMFSHNQNSLDKDKLHNNNDLGRSFTPEHTTKTNDLRHNSENPGMHPKHSLGRGLGFSAKSDQPSTETPKLKEPPSTVTTIKQRKSFGAATIKPLKISSGTNWKDSSSEETLGNHKINKKGRNTNPGISNENDLKKAEQKNFGRPLTKSSLKEKLKAPQAEDDDIGEDMLKSPVSKNETKIKLGHDNLKTQGSLVKENFGRSLFKIHPVKISKTPKSEEDEDDKSFISSGNDFQPSQDSSPGVAAFSGRISQNSIRNHETSQKLENISEFTERSKLEDQNILTSSVPSQQSLETTEQPLSRRRSLIFFP